MRQIAARLDIGLSTVARDLQVPAPEDGNQRAATHGTHSAAILGPLRERHARELREDFPKLDGRRLALLADLLSRIDAGTTWLDAQGGIVRDHRGEVFPVVDRVATWGTTAWKLIGEAAKEHLSDVPSSQRLLLLEKAASYAAGSEGPGFEEVTGPSESAAGACVDPDAEGGMAPPRGSARHPAQRTGVAA